MVCTTRSQQEAVAALGPSTLAATDAKEWIVVDLAVPADRAAVELLPPARCGRHGPSSIGYHHTVDDAVASACSCIAVLMPAPAVDLVQRIAEDDRLLPEKATSFQPKPSSAPDHSARRIRRAELISTSTRDAAVPPAR